MRTALITTGTELLLGDVQDSHLPFIAGELSRLGLRISEHRTLPDGSLIQAGLKEMFDRTDILFVTGGLGPTTDDITREVLSELLELPLEHDPAVMNAISARLQERRIPITERIARQAQVPRGAVILPNHHGTAPGFYIRRHINAALGSPELFVLPGPPRELRPMFRESVIPLLQSIAPARVSERRVYRIVNIGESLVEREIGKQVLAIPGIELGYCARPGEVDLRVIGAPESLRRADAIITGKLADSIFSVSDETLEQVLVRQLTARRHTLSLAESCTGGLLANRLTDVPGASNVLLAGYVVYSNAAKTDVLSVDPQLIQKHGAVSEPVARAMAEGARHRAGSTYALATTGVAGPGGGTLEKPVGTVFVALALPASPTTTARLFFPNDRVTFKYQTAQAAFDMLRRQIT
jgi:nicotinamide-nucleotide amidase